MHVCTLRWTVVGNAGDDHTIVDFCRKHSEPRARRLVCFSEAHQVFHDRLQDINRHDHVDVNRLLAIRRLLDVERSDPPQRAVASDQGRSAPERMRRCSEDRVVEHVLPIPSKLTARDDFHAHSVFDTAATGKDRRIANTQ